MSRLVMNAVTKTMVPAAGGEGLSKFFLTQSDMNSQPRPTMNPGKQGCYI